MRKSLLFIVAAFCLSGFLLSGFILLFSTVGTAFSLTVGQCLALFFGSIVSSTGFASGYGHAIEQMD